MLAQCKKCELNIYPQIPPTEPFSSNLAIVGGSTNNQELVAKTPFVGPSGQLLKETLAKAGFTDTPYITNSLLCMIPEDTNIQRAHIAHCRSRVLAELAIVKPKIILAFGNIALHTLTNNYKLKIGSAHSTPIPFGDSLIIPIYHPTAVLNAIGNYKTFLNGFIYAKQLLDNPTHKKDPGITTYQVATKENIDSLLPLLHGTISCDIETTSLDPKKAQILVVGLEYAKNKVVVFQSDMLPYIKEILSNCKTIYQRMQFDTAVLSEHGIEIEGQHDTLLQHYVLNENERGHDLDSLSRLFLGAKDYGFDVDKSKMAELSEDQRNLLVAMDADHTYQLSDLFLPQIEADPNLKKLYYKVLIPGINFLRRMSQKGFYVRQEYLAQYHKKLQIELDILKGQVIDSFGAIWNREGYLVQTDAKSAPVELNPNSSQQLAFIIYDQLKIIPKIHKKNKRCTDKDIIADIEDRHYGFTYLLKYKELAKLMSTYVKGIEKRVDPDNRLRSSFSLQTTVTGRLSSSKPNVQTIPRNPIVKSIFGAPEGRLLIEADYSQLELRLLAHFSDDDFLLETFRQGKDIHSAMASEIYGTNFTKEDRTNVKPVNFGIIYGITAFSIAQQLNISLREAQMMIDKWFERAPKAKQYLDDCETQLLTGTPFVTPFGRYRRYGVIANDQGLKNESRNFKIQSTGSDLNLVSAIELENPLLKLDAFSVNLIHDAILVEAPNNKEKVNKIRALVKETMEQVPIDWLHPKIPFKVDISYGFKWGEMIDK